MAILFKARAKTAAGGMHVLVVLTLFPPQPCLELICSQLKAVFSAWRVRGIVRESAGSLVLRRVVEALGNIIALRARSRAYLVTLWDVEVTNRWEAAMHKPITIITLG